MQVHVGEHLVPPVHHHGQAADQLHQQGQGHAQVCRTGQRAFSLIPSVGVPDPLETKIFGPISFRTGSPFDTRSCTVEAIFSQVCVLFVISVLLSCAYM